MSDTIIDRKAWHPAFVAAAELELKNENNLKFFSEYNLSKEPLSIDLYIRNDNPEIGTIKNELGHIFRRYNILEYKNPGDALTIDTLYKTVGYACLFKGTGETVDKYPEDQITISLFRHAYPRELFAYLKNTGRTIKKIHKGIYYISGIFPFPIQIIVTKELDRKHLGLRILSNDASREDVEEFIRQATSFTIQGDKDNADAVLQVSILANKKLYDEIRRDNGMCKALEELMADVIEEREKKAAENRDNSIMEFLRLKGIDESVVSEIKTLPTINA